MCSRVWGMTSTRPSLPRLTTALEFCAVVIVLSEKTVAPEMALVPLTETSPTTERSPVGPVCPCCGAAKPTIEYVHVVTEGPDTGGYKGVGEGGAIGAPPAVVNAINDALVPFGDCITHLPVTPAKVAAVIEASGVAVGRS